jgi:hypothetical protein
MAALTLAERARLALALPPLIAAEAKLRTLAAAEGIEYTIPAYGGVRTEADQAQLVRWRDEAVAAGEPSYQVAPFGKSYHEVGAAFDTAITKRPASMSLDTARTRLGRLGESIGLTWGGSWTPGNRDIFHFELKGTRASFLPAYAAVRAASPVLSAAQAAGVSGEGMVQAVTSGKLPAVVVVGLLAFFLVGRTS